jgi:hypothetical protein
MFYLLHFKPIFFLVLSYEHYEHLVLYIDSLRVLLSEEIKRNDLEIVENKLKKFVENFKVRIFCFTNTLEILWRRIPNVKCS